MAETEDLSKRKTSFASKIPVDAPIYADVQAGALEFTLTLGTAFGQQVILWNGIYDGKGGSFGGNDVPASDCDNFWELVPKQKHLTYMATIPLGVLPGQSFVAVLDGERKVFVCPQGARPGSKVQVEGPSVSQQQSSKRK